VIPDQIVICGAGTLQGIVIRTAIKALFAIAAGRR
jgi:hypothetical protein